jgi:hypothetical protein
MTLDTATAIAAGSGCLARATEDLAWRLVQHFGEQEPTPEQIQGCVQALRTEAHHLWPPAPAQTPPAADAPVCGIPRAVWDTLSPETHYALARQHVGYTPVQRRPDAWDWTVEEQRQLQGKTVFERLTMGHAGPPNKG